MHVAHDATLLRPQVRRHWQTRRDGVWRGWIVPLVLLLLVGATAVLTASPTALSQRAPNVPQHSTPFGISSGAATHRVVMAAHPPTVLAAAQGVSSCQSCH